MEEQQLSEESFQNLEKETGIPNIDRSLTKYELDLFSYENVLESLYKCAKGVRWKTQTKRFLIHPLTKAFDIYKKVLQGTWEDGDPHSILITYPKKRIGLANNYIDRIYQKVINDKCLYPIMSNKFIAGNAACQTDRGPDYARFMIEDYYRKFFINHGTSFWIIKTDIEGYYPNMSHDYVKMLFKNNTPDGIGNRTEKVLDKQKLKDEETKNKGYYPGSQMLQIAGISTLNKVDHKIKEVLKIKGYVRYQDDLILFCEAKEKAQKALDFLEREVKPFKLKERKTFLLKATDNLNFLGFKYKLSKTGSLSIRVLSKTVRHEKTKLKRMITNLSSGETKFSKIQECFDCFCEHLRYGQTQDLCEALQTELNDLLTLINWPDKLVYKKKPRKSRKKIKQIEDTSRLLPSSST